MSDSRLGRLEASVGELLARQESGRDVRDLTRYVDDPIAFTVEVLGGHPWSAQREIMTAVRDHALVAVAGCNASGKDWMLAALSLWWVYAKGGLVLLTAARQMQAVEILMRKEIARAFTAAKLPGLLGVEALRHLDGRAAILTAVSNEVSRLGGHHDERVFVGITEMSGIEAWAVEGFLGNAMGDRDRIVAVGNPFASADTFRRMFRPDSQWKTFHISALDHPNITGREPAIPGGPTRVGIERLARELGTGSGSYAARVLGQFPAESPEALIPLSWVVAAQDRWKAGTPSAAETTFAVDVSRYGSAETCVCIRRGARVEAFVTWADVDLMESVRRIVALGQQWGVTAPWVPGHPRTGYVLARGRIVVDCVGLGAGLADRLRELRYQVIEFNGGAKAGRTLSDNVEFQNERASAYFLIRDALQAGWLQLPPDELLADELTSIRYRETPVGRVALEDKADVMQRLNRSCDRADALSMSLAAQALADEVRTFRDLAALSRERALF